MTNDGIIIYNSPEILIAGLMDNENRYIEKKDEPQGGPNLDVFTTE